jgi:hypothetical protein
LGPAESVHHERRESQRFEDAYAILREVRTLAGEGHSPVGLDLRFVLPTADAVRERKRETVETERFPNAPEVEATHQPWLDVVVQRDSIGDHNDLPCLTTRLRPAGAGRSLGAK